MNPRHSDSKVTEDPVGCDSEESIDAVPVNSTEISRRMENLSVNSDAHEMNGENTTQEVHEKNADSQNDDNDDEDKEYNELDKELDEISAYLDKMEDWSDSLYKRVLEFAKETNDKETKDFPEQEDSGEN